MADFFLSDIHLRLDKPIHDARLIRFLERVSPKDRLFIVGDLCDFWFSTQQRYLPRAITPGLAALKKFSEQGGRLVLLLGNHDEWLRAFYEKRLGFQITGEPLEVESYGLKLRLEHGHRNRAKPIWKSWLEGRTFFHAFSALPVSLARIAQNALLASNSKHRQSADSGMIAAFEAYTPSLTPAPDIAVFGHVHRVHVSQVGSVRLVVLGDWFDGENYLRVDENGAEHISVPDPRAQVDTDLS